MKSGADDIFFASQTDRFFSAVLNLFLEISYAENFKSELKYNKTENEDPTAKIDSDGIIISVNNAFVFEFGIFENNSDKISILSIINNKDQKRFLDFFGLVKSRKVLRTDFEIRAYEKKFFQLYQIKLQITADDEFSVIFFKTEKKNLNTEKQNLEILSQNKTVVYKLQNLFKSEIVTFSENIEHITGFSALYFIRNGISFFEIVHPEDKYDVINFL